MREIKPFIHDFQVGDEVQLKLGTPYEGRFGTSAGYASPVMIVNAFHELTNEPQCVWLGQNLQPYVAYFNPEILTHVHPSH